MCSIDDYLLDDPNLAPSGTQTHHVSQQDGEGTGSALDPGVPNATEEISSANLPSIRDIEQRNVGSGSLDADQHLEMMVPRVTPPTAENTALHVDTEAPDVQPATVDTLLASGSGQVGQPAEELNAEDSIMQDIEQDMIEADILDMPGDRQHTVQVASPY